MAAAQLCLIRKPRLWRDHSQNRFPGIQLRGGCPETVPRDASRKQVTLDRAPVFEWTAELGKLGSAHETENKLRLGLPRIIQRKKTLQNSIAARFM